MSIQVKAYAKVNLTLDIVGAEGGYHQLDSVVTTIDLFDTIHLSVRKDNLITVQMHGMGSESIPQELNNAYKAGVAFVQQFGTNGADITIYKNIPMGAGLGGSSADVAGVLNGLSKLYGVTDYPTVKALADSLGSDTGYLLTGGFARMQGRGEQVTPLASQVPLHLLLLQPKTPISTPQCYKTYDSMGVNFPYRTPDMIQALAQGDLAQVGKNLSNGLSASAKQLNPDVATAEAELRSFSPLGAVMTGSGSCVFALFESAEMCRWASSRYRGQFDVIQAKSKTLTKGENIWQKKDC